MSLIDPIMSPLLNLDPLLAIFIVSSVLSILITIVYKLMTDQELMKTLKGDMKAAQKEMKNFKDHPKKLMAMQKKTMDKNMKYMMHSMKPTLITFIPIILVFGWLNTNFAYEPILPGEEFEIEITLKNDVYGTIEAFPPKISESIVLLEKDSLKEIDNKVISYKFKGLSKGEWDIVFKVNEIDYKTPVRIDDKKFSAPIANKFDGKDVKQIKVGYEKKVMFEIPILGWKMTWLWTYIILSVVFSIVLRKILKLH